MMKRKHTIISVTVALLLCMSMLAGCAGGSDVTPTTQAADPGTPSAGSTTPDDGTDADNTDADNTDADSAGDNNGDGYDPTATGTYQDGSTPSFSGVKLRLTVNGEEEVIIALYDNTAADALLERLPLEDLSFYDLSNIEKPIQRLEEPISLGQEEPGYDPVTGEMVIYRPWANFTIFYGDFRYSSELVPLGKVESGLNVIASKTEDFTGVLELVVD